jgi:hypothetical protein
MEIERAVGDGQAASELVGQGPACASPPDHHISPRTFSRYDRMQKAYQLLSAYRSYDPEAARKARA